MKRQAEQRETGPCSDRFPLSLTAAGKSPASNAGLERNEPHEASARRRRDPAFRQCRPCPGRLYGSSAAPHARGGFTGSSAEPTAATVQQARSMNDDQHVVLRGTIERRLSHDKYTFRDQTGSIEVEIDDDVWKGLSVGQHDRVEIFGEVDRHRNSVDIEVKRIQKL